MRKLIMKMSISLEGFVVAPNGQMDWMFHTGDDDTLAGSVDRIRQAVLIIIVVKSF